jgi:hypothetical protein
MSERLAAIMIERLLLFALFGVLHGSLMAQCPPMIYTIGEPNAISTGPHNTPFPTEFGRGAHVQYIIPAQMLTDQGFCPGNNITGLSLELLDDDSPGTMTKIRVRAKNSVQENTCNYDDPGFLTPMLEYEVHLDSGTLVIPFLTSPFQWTGAPFNIVLDIAILRNDVPGINPRVVIDTNYVDPIGRYGYGNGNGTMPGWDLQFYAQDSTTFGCVHYLPVVGLYQNIPLGMEDLFSTHQIGGIFPNPTSGSFIIRANTLRSGVRSIHVVDETGRVVMQMPLTTTSNDVPISLEGLSTGIYQVLQVMGTGGARRIGPVSVH